MRDGSGLPTEEYRRQVFDDLYLLAKTSCSRLGFDREYGGMSDPAGSVVAHGTIGSGDLSLMVKAGFLAHGRLTATRAKSVTSAVNALCEELRPHAQTLVDAFAIPGPYVGAASLDGGEVAG